MFFRLLLLLLIAMNLAVAGWLLFGRHVTPAFVTTEAGVPALQLLSERPRHATAQRGGGPVSRAAAASDRCVAVGPFDTQADTRKAMDALTPRVPRIQYRQEQTTQSTGWWVYLPAFANRDDAIAAARSLSSRGISDYYVITAGDRQNTVSLGLFHDPDNARRRRDQIQALGFQPQLSERTETLPQYWVDFVEPDAGDLDWRTYIGAAGINARAESCF